MLDRFSRWFHAVPTTEAPTGEMCARIVYEQWVPIFGVPQELISDQGTQFESFVFRDLMKMLGIQRKRTVAYHPQTNGALERQHRTLKEALIAQCERQRDWDTQLHTILLGMRTAIGENGVSPAMVMFGEQPRVPTLFVDQRLPPGQVTGTQFVTDIINDKSLPRC